MTRSIIIHKLQNYQDYEKKKIVFKSLEQKIIDAQNFTDSETIYEDNPYGDLPDSYDEKGLDTNDKHKIKNEE